MINVQNYSDFASASTSDSDLDLQYQRHGNQYLELFAGQPGRHRGCPGDVSMADRSRPARISISPIFRTATGCWSRPPYSRTSPIDDASARPNLVCAAFCGASRGDREGISAVEFALILPFMLTLYLGSGELGDGLAIQFKATLAARTVADLASQYINIRPTTMSQIFGAASTVATPYSAANMTVTVSELKLPTATRRGRLSGARPTAAMAAPSIRLSRCRPRCSHWRHPLIRLFDPRRGDISVHAGDGLCDHRHNQYLRGYLSRRASTSCVLVYDQRAPRTPPSC